MNQFMCEWGLRYLSWDIIPSCVTSNHFWWFLVIWNSRLNHQGNHKTIMVVLLETIGKMGGMLNDMATCFPIMGAFLWCLSVKNKISNGLNMSIKNVVLQCGFQKHGSAQTNLMSLIKDWRHRCMMRNLHIFLWKLKYVYIYSIAL